MRCNGWKNDNLLLGMMEATTEYATEDYPTNLTIDDDPFGDDYTSVSEDLFYYYYYYDVIVLILRLILCVFFVSASIFLAIVILRFKRLHTRSNIYILHMCFLHVFVYTLPLLYFIIYVMIKGHLHESAFFQTLSTTLSLYITIGFLLGVDWFVFTRKPNWLGTYEKYFKYVLACVYLVFILEWAIAFFYSRVYHLVVLRSLIFTIFYMVYITVLIVLNILKRWLFLTAASKRTEYAFIVSNITIFSFLPLLIFHTINEFTFHVSPYLNLFMHYLEPIPSTIALGHPILIVHLLGKENKYFRMAYSKMFKRSLRNYIDDNLDNSSDRGNDGNENLISDVRIDLNSWKREPIDLTIGMDVESNPYEDDPHYHGHRKTLLEYLSIATDYLSIPVCLTAILTDIMLICFILKYKRLKQRQNYYLLNFALFHFIYIVSTPCLHIVMDIFYSSELDMNWYCAWLRVENFGIFLLLTFVAGFPIDAFIEIRSFRFFKNYERGYFLIFIFFYVFAAILYSAAASVCFKQGFRNNFNFYLVTVYYLVMLVGIFYTSTQIRYKHSTEVNLHYTINVAMSVLLCWLPLFICYSLINIFKDVHNVEIVLWYLAFLPEYIAYSSSIVMVWQLCKRNKYFRVAFQRLFRRPVDESDYAELVAGENALMK
nr:unnamed protein product [Callosobruchus chinensis]